MTIDTMTGEGTRRTLDATEVDALGAPMRGPLLTARDEGYDAARRIWNAMIDRRPALIAPRSVEAYGANYARLSALKAQLDPKNIFCLNPNIAPAG